MTQKSKYYKPNNSINKWANEHSPKMTYKGSINLKKKYYTSLATR